MLPKISQMSIKLETVVTNPLLTVYIGEWPWKIDNGHPTQRGHQFTKYREVAYSMCWLVLHWKMNGQYMPRSTFTVAWHKIWQYTPWIRRAEIAESWEISPLLSSFEMGRLLWGPSFLFTDKKDINHRCYQASSILIVTLLHIDMS